MTEVGQVPNLEEMADRLAIIEIIHTYARGVDRADAEILKSACWDDAELDYGGYKGPAHPFCDALPDGLRKFVNTQIIKIRSALIPNQMLCKFLLICIKIVRV